MQFENKRWVVFPTFIGHMVVWNYEKGVPFEKRWETRGWMTGGSSLEKLATMSITGKGLSFLTLCTYIHSMEGKERKKSNSSLHVSQENRNVQTIHIRFTHDMLFITFMSNPCLGRFSPFDEWSYNCDMPEVIDKWTNQRVVRWPFRLRLWQKYIQPDYELFVLPFQVFSEDSLIHLVCLVAYQIDLYMYIQIMWSPKS